MTSQDVRDSRSRRFLGRPALVAFLVSAVGWASVALLWLFPDTYSLFLFPYYWLGLFGLELYWLAKSSFQLLRGRLDPLGIVLFLAAVSFPVHVVRTAIAMS